MSAEEVIPAHNEGRRRDLRPLAELWPFLRPRSGAMLCAAAALISSTAATLALTGALRLVVDKGFAAGAAARLNQAFIVLLAIAGVLALATSARFYFTARLGERVAADLRIAVYRRALSLDQAYFLRVSAGEVVARLTTDMAIVEALVGQSASVAMRNLLTVVGAVAMLVFVSAPLSLGVGLLAPLVLAPLVLYGRRVRRLSVRAQDRLAETVALAAETLGAVDTVQAFGRQQSVGASFANTVESAFAASLSRLQARALMTGAVILLVFGGVAGVFWLGARQVLAGQLSPGALLQFAALAVLAAGATGSLSEVWGEMQKAAGAMDRIATLLRARPAITSPAIPRPLPEPPRGEVELREVTFAYPGRPDLPVLSGFNLHARPGERIALVGASGAGKSTVLRLLLRFYDPLAGEVCIDGVPIREADPEAVRSRIAFVAQDAPLFSASALDNLRFGREGADAASISAAVKAAQAEAFLNALPLGMATPLGERAKILSGGERQRLAIARALIRSAPILLLDEATSALDSENERLIQRALDEAMKSRTTIVVAHRLATVLKADRILVMEAGRVAEEGSHAELSARGGRYARLVELQFGMEAA
jgi:ATP-binding cassette subfamily B protein